MTTQKQIEANRRNARKSTGPKTEAGKAASAANAISHGLTAAGDVLLQDESVDAFEELQRDMLADLAPQDALQGMLARRIVQLLWRLDRARPARGRALPPRRARRAARQAARAGAEQRPPRRARARVRGQGRQVPGGLSPSPLDEKDRAFEERRREILAVDMEIVLGAPSAMVLVEREESARAFDRLMRYEAMLQRSLNRTLAEFRSLKREAAKEAKAAAEAAAAAENDVLQNETNSPQPTDAAPSRSTHPPGRRIGETPWYSHEKGFLPMKANPAHTDDAAPFRSADPAAPQDPRPPARRLGEPPWYDREEGVPQNEPNPAQPTEKEDDPAP